MLHRLYRLAAPVSYVALAQFLITGDQLRQLFAQLIISATGSVLQIIITNVVNSAFGLPTTTGGLGNGSTSALFT